MTAMERRRAPLLEYIRTHPGCTRGAAYRALGLKTYGPGGWCPQGARWLDCLIRNGDVSWDYLGTGHGFRPQRLWAEV